MFKQILYDEQGRSGNIIYIEDNQQCKFWYEFGGGNCIVYINLPQDKSWLAETGWPLMRKNEIVTYIANQVKKDKMKSAYFIISEDSISFYEK